MPVNSTIEITMQYALRKENNLCILLLSFHKRKSLPKKEDPKLLKESPKFVVEPGLKEATQQNSHKLSKRKGKTGEN